MFSDLTLWDHYCTQKQKKQACTLTEAHTDVLKNNALRPKMKADRRKDRGEFCCAQSSVCHSSSATLCYATKCSVKLVVHYTTHANRLTCNCDTAHWRDSVLTRVVH